MSFFPGLSDTSLYPVPQNVALELGEYRHAGDASPW